MQFLGLQIGDKVPDEKTIWLFKEQLKEKNLAENLFHLFTGQLLGQGIVAKEGSIVDPKKEALLTHPSLMCQDSIIQEKRMQISKKGLLLWNLQKKIKMGKEVDFPKKTPMPPG
jgi:IS5 family transposase